MKRPSRPRRRSAPLWKVYGYQRATVLIADVVVGPWAKAVGAAQEMLRADAEDYQSTPELSRVELILVRHQPPGGPAGHVWHTTVRRGRRPRTYRVVRTVQGVPHP